LSTSGYESGPWIARIEYRSHSSTGSPPLARIWSATASTFDAFGTTSQSASPIRYTKMSSTHPADSVSTSE
jgi:hypothetical protein